MTVRDIFGLIVRVTGLGFVLVGLVDLGHLLVVVAGLPLASSYAPSVTLAAAAFWGVLGVGLLCGANLLTRLIYGRDRRSD